MCLEVLKGCPVCVVVESLVSCWLRAVPRRLGGVWSWIVRALVVAGGVGGGEAESFSEITWELAVSGEVGRPGRVGCTPQNSPSLEVA